MSEILSNIVIEQTNINFSPNNNNINITPEPTALNIFAGGLAIPGGNAGELQYNNGTLAGIPNVTYVSGNLSLGNVSNVKMTGGSNNYVLQTDGSGNLSWVAQIGGVGNSTTGELLFNNSGNVDGVSNTSVTSGTLTFSNLSNLKIDGGTNGYFLQTDGAGNLTWAAGGGGGNGSPGGSNTQIQYNDSGLFGGTVGFTFNKTSNNVAMPNSLSVTNAITANTVTSNTLTINTLSNLGNVANVKISGGVSGQSIVTDGSNNLSFATRADPTWANVATIGIGGVFVGKSYGPNSTVTYTGPGNIFTSNSTTSFSSNNYIYPLTTVTGNVGNLNGIDGYMFAASDSANNIGRNNPNDLTASWTSIATPLQPHKAPMKGANNIVIFATNSNRAAYSTNLGNTWSNSAALPNSGQWQDIAYGNGVFVISTQQAGYNYVAVSADDGLTWGQYQVSSGTTNRNYRNIAYGNGAFYMIAGSAPTSLYKSTDNGQTWGTVTIPGPIQDLTYGNGTLVAVKGNTAPYSPGGAYYSTDSGNTWSSGAMSNIGWSSVVYAEPYFVASATGSNVIAYSTDGNSWSYGNIPGQGGETGWDSSKRILAFANATAPDGYVSIFQSTALFVDGSDGTGGANLQIVPNGTYKMLGGVGGNTGAMWSRVS